MCRCIFFFYSVLQLTPVKHRRRTHTEKYVRWRFNAAPAASRLCGLNYKHTPAASHGNPAAPSLAIPQHPSINSLSLLSVTRGIKHPSLLTTHTVRTKPCADLLKHFRGVFLNDADVKREKESLVCSSDGDWDCVLPKKVSRRFPGVSAWSVNVHIVCVGVCVTCWWVGWGANAKRTSGPLTGVINLPPGHKSLAAFLLCLPPSSALSLQRKRRKRGALPDSRHRKQQLCWRMCYRTIWLRFRQPTLRLAKTV